jgi:hypothetical protein
VQELNLRPSPYQDAATTTELTRHINTSMSKPNPGFEELSLLGRAPYVNNKSYSYVKEFTLVYPKKKFEPFIKDELVWNGKIFGGSKKI